MSAIIIRRASRFALGSCGFVCLRGSSILVSGSLVCRFPGRAAALSAARAPGACWSPLPVAARLAARPWRGAPRLSA